jgi:hypothetical protein
MFRKWIHPLNLSESKKMRSLKQFSKSLAKWTLVVGSFAVGSSAMESQALAHFPFHHRHHHYHGWGLNYYGAYSSFYSSYSYPSCRIFPRYYSVSYYSPTYFAPVYYTPTYYVPTYCPPTYFAPTYFAPTCYTTSWSGGVQQSTGFPISNTNTTRVFPSTSFSAGKTVSNALAMQMRGAESRILGGISIAKLDSANEVVEGVKTESRDQGIKLVSNRPAILQPYSPVWTRAAVGLVDDMVARGDLDDAYTSCKSMERISQPKGAGVYLRQALLSYFSVEVDDAKKPSSDDILKLLELACQGGSTLQPSELSKQSLQDYFAACTVDVNRSLDNLSKSVLESPNQAGQDLLLLAALLKLEGQDDRAKLFATEVKEHSTKSNAFRWNAILDVCLN